MNAYDPVMKYIVGLAAAAAVSLSGWNLLSTVGHEARIGVVEERTMSERDTLRRIEDKVDRLIEREHAAPAAPRRDRGDRDAQSLPSGRRSEAP